MTSRFTVTRRALLAATGTVALAGVPRAIAQPGPALTLRARADTSRLRAEGPATPVTTVDAGSDTPPHLMQGRAAEVAFINELPVATRLRWRGLAGAPPADDPIAPGGRAVFTLPPQAAGTLLGITEPVADWPPAAFAAIVGGAAADAADHDEIVLIEEWRIGADGRAVPPEHEPGSAATVFTVNRNAGFAATAASNSRLRFRFINASQRSIIAIRIPDHPVHVVAIASRPAEPFVARDSQIVLAPGGRLDAMIDVVGAPGTEAPIRLHDGRTLHTLGRLICANDAPARPAPLAAPAPLPADGLPAALDLARAARFALDLSNVPADAPAFSLKRGRVAVLALKNGGARPAVVWLSGHPVRLLDRLDDGWKPFWLDTVVVPPGITERVAFLAEHQGRFPVEVTAPAWGAARHAGWYMVA